VVHTCRSVTVTSVVKVELNLRREQGKDVDLQLDGRVAVVTGASRGIGRSVVERLLDEGMIVAFCARQQSGIDSTVTELEGRGIVDGTVLDVSDHEGVARWVNAVADKYGRLDVLVASTSAKGGIPPTIDGWRASFEVDIASTVALIDAALPHLAISGGSIVQIGTTASIEFHHYPGGGYSYGAMKAALVNYISHLAKESYEVGVRANVVSPGPVWIEGGSWERIKTSKPDYYQQHVDQHPAKRLGTGVEVANVVAFLASSVSSWVNGQNIVVDGGFTQRVGY
jgi:3-oxoacyl-[acyl-carrier protein] reductase